MRLAPVRTCRRAPLPRRLLTLQDSKQPLACPSVHLRLSGDVLIHAFSPPSARVLEELAKVLGHLQHLWQAQPASKVGEEPVHATIIRDPSRILPHQEAPGSSSQISQVGNQTGAANVSFVVWSGLFPHLGTFFILLKQIGTPIPNWYVLWIVLSFSACPPCYPPAASRGWWLEVPGSLATVPLHWGLRYRASGRAAQGHVWHRSDWKLQMEGLEHLRPKLQAERLF